MMKEIVIVALIISLIMIPYTHAWQWRAHVNTYQKDSNAHTYTIGYIDMLKYVCQKEGTCIEDIIFYGKLDMCEVLEKERYSWKFLLWAISEFFNKNTAEKYNELKHMENDKLWQI